MGSFKRLAVWKKAHELAVSTYRVTSNFTKAEQYGLASQMRRAAGSVSANIAEGCGRLGDREMARFLRIARGSATELESHILLAADVGLLGREDSERLVDEADQLQRMLFRLIKCLGSKPPSGTKPKASSS